MRITDIGNKMYIVVQEIVHNIVMVRKEEDKDQIDIVPITTNPFLKLFPCRPRNEVIKESDGMQLTTEDFLVDGKSFTDYLSTKYVAFVNNVPITNQIAKYFSPLFRYAVTDSNDCFIKTWIINVMMRLGIKQNTDPENVKMLLERYYPNIGR